MKRNLGRWVIEGEHLRHNKAWSKDPDKLVCGWGTKAPKMTRGRQAPGELKNWHCSKCRKRAPNEIQFAADLGVVKEKPSLFSYSTLGNLLLTRYTKTFIGQMQQLSTPILSIFKTTDKFKVAGNGSYFLGKK